MIIPFTLFFAFGIYSLNILLYTTGILMDSKSSNTLLTPNAKWAQDTNYIFFTVCLESCEKEKLEINESSLKFECLAGRNLQGVVHSYKLDLSLLKDIDPRESKYGVQDRKIEFTLKKKEVGPFWCRLLKCPAKQHWLRIDFDKWKEENDSGEEDTPEPELTEEELQERQYGVPPIEKKFEKHIAENISKGSSLCPLGSAVMGKAMRMEQSLNEASEENGEAAFDIHGFNPEAPDSDDEPISDIEDTVKP